MNISMSPKMQLTGCVNSLVNIGALVSGIYQGMNESKGVPIDPNLKMAIRYGPLVLSGILGVAAGRVAVKDGTLDQVVANAPYDMDVNTAKGCAKGCMTRMYPIIAVATTAGFEWLGYVIGHGLSKV